MKKNYLYTFTETTSTALEDDSADHIIYSGSVHGGKKNNRDLLNLFQFNKLKPKGGQYLIHNGYMVDSFDPSKLQEGDMTEVLYDYSIRKVWDLQVSELRTYKSTLDKGLYYHRNMEDSVRMVTHRDYGLPVPYVMDYIQALDPHYDLNDFYIRVFVRQNGPIKPLVTDVNKLRSLYVLPDDKIINAMVQVNSTLKEWTADHLERSAYTAVMRSYHALLKIIKANGLLKYKDINDLYQRIRTTDITPAQIANDVILLEEAVNLVSIEGFNRQNISGVAPASMEENTTRNNPATGTNTPARGRT